MKKSVLLASICAAVAAGGALAQSASDSTPAPDTRAADLNKMMEIRNWQAGPSAGDAATKADPNTPPAASDDKRASDLSTMMEIRGWQAGPSSGDATAKIDPAKAAPPAPAPTGSGLDAALQHESTP